MQSAKKLCALIFLILAVWLYSGKSPVLYPGGEVVYDRSFNEIRKVFQISHDSFDSINSWYKQWLVDVPYDIKTGNQEGDVNCSVIKWMEGKHAMTVVICDHPQHRTISTQKI